MTTVLNPIGKVPTTPPRPLNPIPNLSGKTIVLLDNSKHNADALLERIKAQVDAQFSDITWRYERKRGGGYPMGDEIKGRIVSEADLVLASSADCGCTSWSAGDTVELEAAGIPTVLFATTPFYELAKGLCAGQGYADARIIEVEHPLGGMFPADIDDRAAGVADTVTAVLNSK